MQVTAGPRARAQPGGPLIPDDVIEELRRRYDELTHSQKRIAEAIVEDPEFIAFATVDQVAGKLGLSPSTIVRFTYRLGMEGYNDLQDRVRERVRSQLPRNMTASADEDRPTVAHLGESVFAGSFEHDLTILRRTIAGLSREDLERAVDVLIKARRIFLVGGSTSYGVAFYASLTLNRVRGDTFLLAPGDDQTAAHLLQITDQDALLVFTFPPYATSTLRIVRQAKLQGATVVAIADSLISPVGQIVDIVLPALASGISTQNSHVPALSIANALLNGVTLAQSTSALQRYGQLMKVMNSWDAFVLRDGDT